MLRLVILRLICYHSQSSGTEPDDDNDELRRRWLTPTKLIGQLFLVVILAVFDYVWYDCLMRLIDVFCLKDPEEATATTTTDVYSL